MEWISIILPLLQPMLLKCFEKTSMEDPQEYLRSNYNASTGKLDRDVVLDAIPATRRAIRKAHRNASRAERKNFVRLSKSELYEITEKSLIESMNAPPEAVAACREVAAGMPDDDD